MPTINFNVVGLTSVFLSKPGTAGDSWVFHSVFCWKQVKAQMPMQTVLAKNLTKSVIMQ